MDEEIKWLEKLPSWAKANGDVVVIDPDVVFPVFLKILTDNFQEFRDVDKKPTVEALEACRWLFTRHLKKLMYENGGKFLHLQILAKDKKWAEKNYPNQIEKVSVPVLFKKFGLDVLPEAGVIKIPV